MLNGSGEVGIGIKTIVVASPVDADMITEHLANQRSLNSEPVFEVIAREQEINLVLIEYLSVSTAEIIILHSAVPGFRANAVKAIIEQHGERAKLVVAFVPRIGDWFDVVQNLGVLTYLLPLRPEPFRELARELPVLLAEARGDFARRSLSKAQESADEARMLSEPDHAEIQKKPAAGIHLPTQVITSWSSKGGDGKSLVAQELAWQLANVGGHRVLLVDADMSRGYLAQALNQAARKFAERHNITTLAQEFLVSGEISRESFSDHLYAVPDVHIQGESNLRIIFGIASPEAATQPAYSADHGTQGSRFIRALVEKASGVYEFIIFDIGTAITIPVHFAAIKQAGHLLVLATPFRPSVAPTREGIRQLEAHQAVQRGQLRLVLNRWSPEALVKRDELPDFLGVPLFAVIPLVEEGQLMGVINQGFFVSELVWRKEKKHRELQSFVAGVSSLAENFVPGIVAAFRNRLNQPCSKKQAFWKRL